MRNQLRQFHSPFPGTDLTHMMIAQLMTFCHNGSWKVVPLFEQWLLFPPIHWLFHHQNILNKYTMRGDMTSFQFQAKSHSPILLIIHLLVGAHHMEHIWIDHHVEWAQNVLLCTWTPSVDEEVSSTSLAFVCVQFYTFQNTLMFIFYFVLKVTF